MFQSCFDLDNHILFALKLIICHVHIFFYIFPVVLFVKLSNFYDTIKHRIGLPVGSSPIYTTRGLNPVKIVSEKALFVFQIAKVIYIVIDTSVIYPYFCSVCLDRFFFCYRK